MTNTEGWPWSMVGARGRLLGDGHYGHGHRLADQMRPTLLVENRLRGATRGQPDPARGRRNPTPNRRRKGRQEIDREASQAGGCRRADCRRGGGRRAAEAVGQAARSAGSGSPKLSTIASRATPTSTSPTQMECVVSTAYKYVNKTVAGYARHRRGSLSDDAGAAADHAAEAHGSGCRRLGWPRRDDEIIKTSTIPRRSVADAEARSNLLAGKAGHHHSITSRCRGDSSAADLSAQHVLSQAPIITSWPRERFAPVVDCMALPIFWRCALQIAFPHWSRPLFGRRARVFVSGSGIENTRRIGRRLSFVGRRDGELLGGRFRVALQREAGHLSDRFGRLPRRWHTDQVY